MSLTVHRAKSWRRPPFLANVRGFRADFRRLRRTVTLAQQDERKLDENGPLKG